MTCLIATREDLGVMENPNSRGSFFKDASLVHRLNAFSGQLSSEGPETTLTLYEMKLPINHTHLFIISFFSQIVSTKQMVGH